MIRCLCGQESENGSDLWQCRKCGSTFHLPSNYEGDFELVSGDLTYRYRTYLGLLFFVSILAQCILAYWLSGSKRVSVIYLFPFLGVFMVAYGFSDELRVVP